MDRIEIQNGSLIVPEFPTIPFIEGDGIGKDIWPVVKKIVDTAVTKCYYGKRGINWLEVYAGEKAYNKFGTWLPEETIKTFKDYHIGIKGPLNTPDMGGVRSLNAALRQDLDLYVCLRPVRWYRGVASPLKHPDRVDMVVFRENTEDLYAGIEWMSGTIEANKVLHFLEDNMRVKKIRSTRCSSFGIKLISREGSERLMRAAIHYALEKGLPTVTIIHKGDVMRYTEGAFKNWCYDVAENEFEDRIFTWRQYEKLRKDTGDAFAKAEYENAVMRGKLIVNDEVTDVFMQNAILYPEKYSVVATPNISGDYISNLLAAEVGGIGIAPGANINYLTGRAIFEATHGTAPDIAGLNKANPCSLLLSAAMLLEYIKWDEASEVIIKTVERMLVQGKATEDLSKFMDNGQRMTTDEFGAEIIRLINGI
ncbi:MAG: NADP-dependent isocitrate dehydrogenase [Bacteroidales bacterium]